MKIMIEVSDKEFGLDIQDKFQDFFKRISAEIERRLIMGDELVCGYFERETAEMFLNAFKNALYIHDNSINGDKINSIHIDKDFIDVYGKNETVTFTVGQEVPKELGWVINELRQKTRKER